MKDEKLETWLAASRRRALRAILFSPRRAAERSEHGAAPYNSALAD
jgi:hypothetical protein